jgi:predicted ATPase/transcriptional regulator with XRE-family HTH domain
LWHAADPVPVAPDSPGSPHGGRRVCDASLPTRLEPPYAVQAMTEQVGFAALLRRCRRASGLTQAELAARAGLAVRTVRELERGRTVRPQRTTAALLADALSLAGRERSRFLASARNAPPPTPISVPAPRAPADDVPGGSPLPPPPDLIGRDDEVAELATLVGTPVPPGPQILTLVGLAGVGKSALAVAVAHRVSDRFPGGVAGITIDEQGEPAEALASICFVLGVAELTDLAARSARTPTLLLLDAVERAPQKVREVLRSLPPGVRVIMTGQAPVDASGERVWPVAPLKPPPARYDMSLAEAASYPAVALFLDRLARVRPEPLAGDEVSALVGLVRRLGGLPLALELAAAHGRLLRLPEIMERYGDRVLDLGSGAEQTLRDAVAGSYRLLGQAERYGLRRLAVFRHRWSVELAERLLGQGQDPVPLLDRLVSLGLAAVSGAREHRFRLLDVVRDFATEQAALQGELAAARRDHARVIAQLAERTAPQLAGPNLRDAVARLDDLAADIWAALSYAANDDPHTALRLAAQLPRWWRFRGRDVAGRRWLHRLLDDPRTASAAPLVRAWAQVGLAQLANEHGEGAAERVATESVLAEFRRLGDIGGELATCNVLSALCLADGRHEDARRHTEAALAAAARAGRLRDQAVAQTNLTWHDIRTGDLATARRRLATADRLAAQVGEDRLRVLVGANLAEVARLQGRCEEAVALGSRVLARLTDVGDPGHRRRVLGTVGQALAALGRTTEAERLLESLRASDDKGVAAAVCAIIEARLAMARGDREAAAEWFATAAAGFRRGQDRRDVVEALVGLVACTRDPQRRARVMAELEQVAADGGFTLLPLETELLDTSALRS